MLNAAVGAAFGDASIVDNFLTKWKNVERSVSDDILKVTAVYRWNTHPVLISVSVQSFFEIACNAL